VYRALRRQLDETERLGWLDEEMAVLANPATYQTDPENAWQRLKLRSRDQRYLGVLKELARWRETQAQARDLPRGHLLRDEAIQELAAEMPRDVEALQRLRSVPKGVATGRLGQALLDAVAAGLALPPDALPNPPLPPKLPRGIGPLVDLLKVLLKLRCEEAEVAAKLVASAADLELLAADDGADIPAMHGWRRELFGAEALALKQGQIAIAATARGLRIVSTDPSQPPPAQPRRRRSRRSGAGSRRRGRGSQTDAPPLPPSGSAPDPSD
jgi:ribonuclease D